MQRKANGQTSILPNPEELNLMLDGYGLWHLHLCDQFPRVDRPILVMGMRQVYLLDFTVIGRRLTNANVEVTKKEEE